MCKTDTLQASVNNAKRWTHLHKLRSNNQQLNVFFIRRRNNWSADQGWRKVHKTLIILVFIYELKPWSLRRKEELLLEKTEMRLLRGILGSRWKEARIFVVKWKWEWRVFFMRCVKLGYNGMVMWNGEKKTTVQYESWKQKFTGNEAKEKMDERGITRYQTVQTHRSRPWGVANSCGWPISRGIYSRKEKKLESYECYTNCVWTIEREIRWN